MILNMIKHMPWEINIANILGAYTDTIIADVHNTMELVRTKYGKP